MTRPRPAPNPHLAIDRLAAVRRAMTSLAAEEEALARRVFALPDGLHDGMACGVAIVTGRDGMRRIEVFGDALAGGPPADPSGEAAAPPAQME